MIRKIANLGLDLSFDTDYNLGPNVILNGDFSNWTADNPDNWVVQGEAGVDPMITEVSGTCRMYTSGAYIDIHQNSILTLGRTYQYYIEVPVYVAGTVQVSDDGVNSIIDISAAGKYSFVYIPDNANFFIKRLVSPVDMNFDNISVREIL